MPRTLIEAIRYFSDLDVVTEHFARLRWPDGFICPECGGKEYSYLKTRRLWKCKACKKQTSVKKGTIFEDSPIGLDKWLPAVWLIANCKNGVSSHELARSIGVCQKTGWFMLHRIRLAMQTGTFQKLSGEVEADETFIGGAARNMHPTRRRKKFGIAQAPKNPHGHKTKVMGMLERDGEVQVSVIESLHQSTVHQKIREAVLPGSFIYTDKMGGYRGIDAFGEYEHMGCGPCREVRRWPGTRQRPGELLEPAKAWPERYLRERGAFPLVPLPDEQAYRYNCREGEDVERFAGVVGNAAGKRVTWKELTNKEAKTEPPPPVPPRKRRRVLPQ